jgi:hypothetical protein
LLRIAALPLLLVLSRRVRPAAVRCLAVAARGGLVRGRRVILTLSRVASGLGLTVRCLRWGPGTELAQRRLVPSVGRLHLLAGAVRPLAGSVNGRRRLVGPVGARLLAERLIGRSVWVRRSIRRHLSLAIALGRLLAVRARIRRRRLGVYRLSLRGIRRKALTLLAI